MLARTHVNLGFLAAILVKVPLLPIPTVIVVALFNMAPGILKFLFLPIFITAAVTWPEKAGMFLIPIAVVVGSLILDLDEPNSTLSALIAPTRFVIRVLLVLIGGVIIWQGWAITGAVVTGVILTLTGLLNLNILPIGKLQRVLLIIAGLGLVYWSYSNILTALGMLYILMGVLSHRGLTHSPEGIVICLLGAWWFTKNIGTPELMLPFAVGCIAHYLADALSNHGVYATYLGQLKLSLPIINTSSLLERVGGFVVMIVVMMLLLGGVGELQRLMTIIKTLIS